MDTPAGAEGGEHAQQKVKQSNQNASHEHRRPYSIHPEHQKPELPQRLQEMANEEYPPLPKVPIGNSSGLTPSPADNNLETSIQNKHSPRERGTGRVYSNGSTYNPLLY